LCWLGVRHSRGRKGVEVAQQLLYTETREVESR
jgi:hypothetical protein